MTVYKFCIFCLLCHLDTAGFVFDLQAVAALLFCNVTGYEILSGRLLPFSETCNFELGWFCYLDTSQKKLRRAYHEILIHLCLILPI